MSCNALDPMPQAAAFRRDADEVMHLSRIGCSHPTRLSFLRRLLRRMQAESWCFDRPLWDIDARGVGRAVYRASGPVRSYCLVAFAHELPPEARSDRVIATAWDATFALFDGTPTADDLTRLAANVPLQEAGRISPRELSLSRANRSVRLFDHVVERLAAGQQPDPAMLRDTGYLMRTTAVYGSGKFGAADRGMIANRPELSAPFQAEMLSVWLTRTFTVDLVNHLAAARGGARATRLNSTLRRTLGVGNSTGLGMAPFLVRHPVLLNNWMLAREEALARVRAQARATETSIAAFETALAAAIDNADEWHSTHPVQIAKLRDLRDGLARLADHVVQGWVPQAPLPWNALWTWGQANLPLEAQEALLALMLEPHGDLVDGLADCMDADENRFFSIDGAMPVATMRDILVARYGWALDVDYDDPANSARFWYISEEKLEPRLGERFSEPGAERELPLDVGRQAAALLRALSDQPGALPIAGFLLTHPEHRLMVRRAQISAGHPFADIRDNLISANMLPMDLLRCKLAFFGATRFDPRSDRWLRINLFQGAPYPDEMQGAGTP
ncbi:hypothetical protein SAMN05443999_104244 [Roseovarius azorensis]|uniref:Uncharacterized protein n=1 Tax=Roseovarius azorensis TaxID=1287727 RepID=A0A1H7NVT7_9RHOB|nr:hypothetical protein [Roseovarius azorensis]SEL27673.1 hypothetical protein SAMN05443999_104244 [Roseovarius azorensis]